MTAQKVSKMTDEGSCLDLTPDGVALGCLTDDELEKTAALLKLVWPNGGFTVDYLHWLYRKNPIGKAEICNVWQEGQIVAHYAAIPIKAKLFGVQEQGLLSLNTAVHPDHRGKGYFKTLAIRAFEEAHKRGANYVIGVANANSTTLFRKQLRFQLVCSLVTKLGIGGIRRTPALNLESLDFDHCWETRTLEWRMGRPGAKYHVVENATNTTVLCETRKYGIWARIDGLVLPKIDMPNTRTFRWNPITIWIGLDPRCDWRRSMYFDIPNRAKPSPLNLIFKDLTDQGRVLAPNKVLFSLLDFDAY